MAFLRTTQLSTDASLTTPITAIIKFDFHLAKVTQGYEINKQRAFFIAGKADPTEYFLKQEGKQLPAFA
jgi:hypothetical protein